MKLNVLTLSLSVFIFALPATASKTDQPDMPDLDGKGKSLQKNIPQHHLNPQENPTVSKPSTSVDTLTNTLLASIEEPLGRYLNPASTEFEQKENLKKINQSFDSFRDNLLKELKKIADKEFQPPPKILNKE